MSDNYETARQRLANIARENALAAIAFVPGPNFRYVSGLSFHLMERPTLLFVTSDNRVVGVMPELERQKWTETFPTAETFYWLDHEGYAGAFAAASRAMPDGRIGVEGMLMRAFELRALEAAFGADRIADAEKELRSLRLVKSEMEIAALRKAVAISQIALHETLDQLKSGMTERQIVALLKSRMLANGAAGFAFEPVVLIGENAANPHGEPGDRALYAGAPLLIDFGAMWGGLNADITRTFFFEHVSDHHADIYNTVLDANTRGRSVAGPSLTAHDLDTEVTGVLKASAHARLIVHKTGHGLGLLVHEAPQVMIGNPEPLVEGIVLTIEPGLYGPGDIGVRIEDDVLITAAGNTSLTDFPRELTVLKGTRS
ncbi:Xaa-Pro peptidase family protein [Hoeflea sp. AS60]|uniref:M24 family metallopeptidase n=1 Tax=Hoeflea sp. AS60 TaxID=3135780 RepID=UPI0031805976